MTSRPEELHDNEADLRARLAEAEEAIRALRDGEVDAVVVGGGHDHVYTLDTADKPYRLLVEQMPQAAATLTVDGTILYCNRRFCEMVARGSSELLGRPIQDLVSPAYREEFARVLGTARDIEVQRDVVFERADGATVPTFLGITSLREGALGLCLMVSDLTQQRHYVELQETQRALREADRRKDEFLATLAHELRNPLAPIRNAVRILGVADPGQPEFQWAREVVDRQTQHMTRLLEDLLDVSRIASNKLKLRRERVQLAAVVEVAVETSRPLIESGGHALVVTLPDEPISLDGDAVRLAQVFANLLNNAAKYTESGGAIRLTAAVDGREVVVDVADQGIGISAEMLPRVFTIFSQAEPALARAQGGLGIGLSLVRGLVDLHGGRIEARSDGPGRGSCFTVRLPLASSQSASVRGDAAELAPGASCHILVVDDNRDTADSLALVLRSMGHNVAAVYDGFQALEVGDRTRPDVVLVDIGMPRMSGYEACRLIRQQEWGHEAVLVATTGWGQDEDRRKSADAGFDLHVVKPVEPDDLMRRVEQLVRAGRRASAHAAPISASAPRAAARPDRAAR